jgi:hypothetical protein
LLDRSNWRTQLNANNLMSKPFLLNLIGVFWVNVIISFIIKCVNELFDPKKFRRNFGPRESLVVDETCLCRRRATIRAAD